MNSLPYPMFRFEFWPNCENFVYLFIYLSQNMPSNTCNCSFYHRDFKNNSIRYLICSLQGQSSTHISIGNLTFFLTHNFRPSDICGKTIQFYNSYDRMIMCFNSRRMLIFRSPVYYGGIFKFKMVATYGDNCNNWILVKWGIKLPKWSWKKSESRKIIIDGFVVQRSARNTLYSRFHCKTKCKVHAAYDQK